MKMALFGRAQLHLRRKNGVSERTNRTLMNMVRAMLNEFGLPPEFWSEAVITAFLLRNITGQRKLDMITPIEALTGNILNVQHLRIFGAMYGTSIAHKTSFNKEVEKAFC